MKRKKSARNGFALVVALSFLVLLMIVATGVLAFGQQQMHAARMTRDYLKAKVIAESGLNVAFNDIRGGIDRVALYVGDETEFGDGAYAVTIEEVGESEDENVRFLRITSVGRCGISETSATLAVRHRHVEGFTDNPDLDTVLFNAITCLGQIGINGSPTIVGNVASATAITTKGNAFNVTGTGYTPSFSGRSGRFSGGVDTDDPGPYSVNWGNVLQMDKYIAASVTHDGRPWTSYPPDTIVYTPNAVAISGGTLRCMIISDKNITISGNARLLQPATYPVLVSLNGSITITGTPEVNGLVASLSGSGTMGKASGTPVINGSVFIMGGLPDSGNVTINHMPLDIRPPDTPEADDIVEVVAWQ